MPTKTKYIYDWNALESEWLGSSESLEDFRKRKGISSHWFWVKVTKEGWADHKHKLNAEAMLKVERKLINGNAERWANQIKLWQAVETRAAQALRDPERSTPKNAGEIAFVVEKSLKAQKLILGEDIGEGGLTQNLFIGIQALIAQTKQVPQNVIGNQIQNDKISNALPSNSNDSDIIEEL